MGWVPGMVDALHISGDGVSHLLSKTWSGLEWLRDVRDMLSGKDGECICKINIIVIFVCVTFIIDLKRANNICKKDKNM